MQTSNTNSTRDCSWQIKPAENWCESKRAGFFYSRCAIFFNVYYAWKCLRKKKCHYHLKNVFIVSLSASTYDWFTGYFLPVSDWSQTSKQTKTDTGYLSMFYLLWFWGNQSLHLVFSSKFLRYLSRKQMSLTHEQLYFNDQGYHNYRTFSYNRNELS